MNVRRAFLCVIAAALLVALFHAAPAAGQESSQPALVLWAKDPMTRTFPLEEPPENASAVCRMKAARGEGEMAQVALHTAGFRPVNLEAAAGGLVGPGGAVIPAGAIDVFYARYVPVKFSTGDQRPGDVEREAPAFFPDPLPHPRSRLLYPF